MSKDGVGFSKTKSNFGRKGWGILVLTFFSIMFMSSIVYDSLNVTIAVFSKKYDINPATLYIFSTICAWISVIGAVFWGVVCTKKTIRFAWAAALFLATAICLVWGFAPNPGVYFICLAIASIAGMGFAYIANLNVISNWFPRKKGLAMGWVTSLIQRGKASLDRIHTILLTSPEINEAVHAKPLLSTRGEIVFESVLFK